MNIRDKLKEIMSILNIRVMELAGILYIDEYKLYRLINKRINTIPKKATKKAESVYEICGNWDVARLGKIPKGLIKMRIKGGSLYFELQKLSLDEEKCIKCFSNIENMVKQRRVVNEEGGLWE